MQHDLRKEVLVKPTSKLLNTIHAKNYNNLFVNLRVILVFIALVKARTNVKGANFSFEILLEMHILRAISKPQQLLVISFDFVLSDPDHQCLFCSTIEPKIETAKIDNSSMLQLTWMNVKAHRANMADHAQTM